VLVDERWTDEPGNLALSRAIGDFEFKQNFSLEAEKQIVTADPEFITHKIDSEEEFLVLACDGRSSRRKSSNSSPVGIWDCLSSQQVVDFVRRAVANGDDLSKICEDLMVKCLATDSETGGIGCDNMTVVVVALLNGRTPEEWKAWVKERVDNKGELLRAFRLYHRKAHDQLATTPQSRYQTSLAKLKTLASADLVGGLAGVDLGSRVPEVWPTSPAFLAPRVLRSPTRIRRRAMMTRTICTLSVKRRRRGGRLKLWRMASTRMTRRSKRD